MKKCVQYIIFLFLVFIVGNKVFAENFYEVTFNDTKHYIDTDSIILVKYPYERIRFTKQGTMFYNDTLYKTTSYNEIDCRKRTLQMLQGAIYDENNNLIASPKQYSEEYILPDTFGQELFDLFCVKRIMRPKY